MKKTLKRFLAFTLSLLLIVGLFPYNSLEVKAAGGLNISAQISESRDEQWFSLNNTTGHDIQGSFTVSDSSLSVEDGAGNPLNGTIIIPAGSSDITVRTSASIDVTFIGNVMNDDDTLGASVMGYARSLNQYYITIYGKCGDKVLWEDNTQVLGTGSAYSTLLYDAGEALYTDEKTGKAYQMQGSASRIFSDGMASFVVEYTEVVYTEKKIPVYLVDTKNNILKEESIKVAVGASGTYTAPETFEAEGKTYFFSDTNEFDTVEHPYTSTETSYSFVYEAEEAAPNYTYSVPVYWVDETNGESIGEASILVPKDTGYGTYTAPEVLIVGTKKYELANGAISQIKHVANDKTASYTINYVCTEDYSPYNVEFRMIDSSTGETLATDTAQATYDGGDVYYEVSKEPLEVNGSTYILVAGQDASFTHSYGSDTTVYNIYYEPANEENAGTYNLTVRYINLTSNTVFQQETIPVAVGDKDKTITAPEEVPAVGTTLVKLNGQDNGYVHTYSDSRRDYNIYYRDINDSDAAKTIVTEVPVYRTITTGGGENITYRTVVTEIEAPDGTVTTADETGNVADTTPAETPETNAPETQPETTTIEDEQTPLAETPETNALETEQETKTIDDEATPLASGIGSTASTNNVLPIAAGVIAGIAILAFGIVFFLKKRKTQN